MKSILIRDNLQDTGKVPSAGKISISPDIIPFGTEPVSDPLQFFTGNYDEDVAKEVEAGQQNYIYIRGKILVAESNTSDNNEGKIYLYFASLSQLEDPGKWTSIRTASGKEYSEVTIGEGGDIVVSEPFTWEPPAADGGKDFGLIARAVTPDDPNPLPAEIENFHKYDRNNVEIALREVTLKPLPVPKRIFSTSILYDQGPTGRQMMFKLVCSEAKGGDVLLSSTKQGPEPLITIPKTEITENDGFVVGITSKVPANYSDTLTFEYWAVEEPGDGFEIEFQITYQEPSDAGGGEGVGPTRAVIVEDVTTSV